MNRPGRYLAVGFVLGVVATRRLGRRRRRARRRATWQRAAVEAVTLAFAVREIAAELEAYEGQGEIGSPSTRRSVDAGSRRPELPAADRGGNDNGNHEVRQGS